MMTCRPETHGWQGFPEYATFRAKAGELPHCLHGGSARSLDATTKTTTRAWPRSTTTTTTTHKPRQAIRWSCLRPGFREPTIPEDHRMATYCQGRFLLPSELWPSPRTPRQEQRPYRIGGCMDRLTCCHKMPQRPFDSFGR